MDCSQPDVCPSTTCAPGKCKPDGCHSSSAPQGTPCSEDNGKFCDGLGKCVQCALDAECGDPSTRCMEGVYTPAKCVSGTCVIGPEEGCTDVGKVCRPDGCGPCMMDTECGAGVGICSQPWCNLTNGLCQQFTMQGAPCTTGAPMDSVCNGEGACLQGKYVFVTEAPYKPNFGGVMGADMKCSDAASAVPLGGQWRAWISVLGSSAKTHFVNGALGPYLLLDGTKVGSSLGSILAIGMLTNGIDRTEKNEQLQGLPPVWTGTNFLGTATLTTCSGWSPMTAAMDSGTVGLAGAKDASWTDTGMPLPCDMKAHLYCYQP